MKERIYKYKLDFYYKSLIIYFVTLIIYILIKGRFFHASFEVVVKDPIIYIIAIFIIFFLTMLLANTIRAREIIIGEDKIIFKNRFGQRDVKITEILAIRFSREKRRSRKDRSDVRYVKLRLTGRKRLFKIRLNDYQDEVELANEFSIISKNIETKKNK
ncbi:MAG: hypothetical protein KDD00_00765 [Ignavibacteriae bacterium]|nr:hypothetical protein [Ignavibacteriota bacterium]